MATQTSTTYGTAASTQTTSQQPQAEQPVLNKDTLSPP